jgi:hypothetical protein
VSISKENLLMEWQLDMIMNIKFLLIYPSFTERLSLGSGCLKAGKNAADFGCTY